jgi:hypothetical protein
MNKRRNQWCINDKKSDPRVSFYLRVLLLRVLLSVCDLAEDGQSLPIRVPPLSINFPTGAYVKVTYTSFATLHSLSFSWWVSQ